MLVKKDDRHGGPNDKDMGGRDEQSSSQQNMYIQDAEAVDTHSGTWGQHEQNQLQAGLAWLQTALLAARGNSFPISLSSQHAQPPNQQETSNNAPAPSSHMDESGGGASRSSPSLAPVSSSATMEMLRQPDYMSYFGQGQFHSSNRPNQESANEGMPHQNSLTRTTASRPALLEQMGRNMVDPSRQAGSSAQPVPDHLTGFGHVISNINLQNEEINRRFQNGATLVPCRARGMPKDHAKNACLIVPNNVKHGEGLLCSHTHCQNKGIRFVYCEVCEHPVAKYNFTTRHKHLEVFKPSAGRQSAGKNIPKGGKNGGPGVGANADKKKVRGPPSGSMKRPQSSHDDNALEGSRPSKLQKKELGNMRSNFDGAMANSRIAWTHSQDDTGDGGFSSDPSSSQKVTGSNAKAVSLVGSSADNSSRGDSMDAGDGLNNLKSNDTSLSSSFHNGNNPSEKRWLTLLKERPASNNTEKMKAWLQNIILASENNVAVPAVTTQTGRSSEKSSSDGSASSSGEEDGTSDVAFSNLIDDGMAFAQNIQNESSSVTSSRTGSKTGAESSSGNSNGD